MNLVDYNVEYVNRLNIDKKYTSMSKNVCLQTNTNEFMRQYIGGLVCNTNYLFQFDLPPHFQRALMFDLIFMNDNYQQTVKVDIIDNNTLSTTILLSEKNTRLQRVCDSTAEENLKDFDQFYRGNLMQKNTQGTNIKIIFNESCKYVWLGSQWEEKTLKNLKIGIIQLNISLCDPACLTCSNISGNCVTCSETKSGNTCECRDQSKFLLKGLCVQQCPQQQFYFPYNKKCIFISGCTNISVDDGICIKCQSNLFLFDGQCISTCPAGFEKIVSGNVCEEQSLIPGPYLLKGILSSDNFSILEIDKLGIIIINNFCADSNCSVISLCGTYQLLGGFYINQKETTIKLPKYTTNKKFAKIIFKYFFIDADSSSQANNLEIFVSLNSLQIQIDATQSTKSNICGLENQEWFGIFSYSFTLTAQDKTNLQIIIANKNSQSVQSSDEGTQNDHPYFGIRELSFVAFDCLQSNCLQCDISSCTQCQSGYYVSGTECKKCSNELCKECTNDQCYQCKHSSLLLYAGTCICPPNKFLDNVDKTCHNCQDQKCETCTDSSQQGCTKCQNNLYLKVEDSNNSISCSDCNLEGYYKDETNKKCLKCSKNCKSCTGPSNQECSVCIQLHSFDKSKNCILCPTDLFYQDGNNCKECHSSCQKCKGDLDTNCQQCKPNTYFLNGVCKQCSTNNGFYIDGQNCSQCDNSCKTCTGKQQKECLTCVSGYYLKDDGTCDDCDDPLFYIDKTNTKCLKCHDSCAKCKGSEQKDCTTCQANLHQIDNKCIKCEGKGLFLNNLSLCEKCSENCEQCDDQGCLKCENNYQIDEITKRCVICGQHKSHYIDNNFCKKCHITCGDCLGPTENDCKTCASNYYMDSQHKNTCYLCPAQPQQSSENFCCECEWLCSKCDSSTTFCQTCKCIKCQEGYFNSNGKCVTKCSSLGYNYVENLINRTCECKMGYIYEVIQINNKQAMNYCSQTIPLGFFCNHQNICHECSLDNTCYKCSSESQCSQCIDKYFLWEGKCTEDCYPHLNIIRKEDQGICSCPDSYFLIDQSEQNNIGMSKCEVKLKITQFSIENILISSNEQESTNKKLQNNFITLTFNRNPTNKESIGCDFKLTDKTLVKDKDYKIGKQLFTNNVLQIEIESQENYKIQECTITINGQSQNIYFSQTILVSKDYAKNPEQEKVKQISSTMNNVSEALTVSSNKHVQGLLDFLKTFQLLCYTSNFVQLLAPLTLIKDFLPPQAAYGTILGASFVFTTIPAPNQLNFQSENIDKNDKNQQQEKDYDDLNTIKNTKQQVLKAFGLDEYLYKNFIIVQLSISLISLIILLCLLARHFMLGKQYTLNIVDKLSNFLASYIQGSITVSLFSITLSTYNRYQQYVGIFQIICNIFFILELFYLFKSRTTEYLSKNMPNFFQNINYAAKGAQSYLLISLLKKYLVITLILTMTAKPFTCTIIIGVIFCLNGLYLLYYRFFEFILLNVLKITQEFIISSLFFIIANAIKRKQEKMSSNILSNEDLNAIQNDGKIILILIIVCLILSFIIFLFRLILTIKDLINKIKQYKEDKKQKQQNIEMMFEFSKLDVSKDSSKKYYSNDQHISVYRSNLAILKNNDYFEKQTSFDNNIGSGEID